MPRTKKKVKSIVKTKVISARVTEVVHELLHQQAEDAGMTLSEFAAQMLMKGRVNTSYAVYRQKVRRPRGDPAQLVSTEEKTTETGNRHPGLHLQRGGAVHCLSALADVFGQQAEKAENLSASC